MDKSVYILVEMLPNGGPKIVELFEAENLAMAREYASARHETELDWYVQRFRVEGPFPLGRLTRMEDGRLWSPVKPQILPLLSGE